MLKLTKKVAEDVVATYRGWMEGKGYPEEEVTVCANGAREYRLSRGGSTARAMPSLSACASGRPIYTMHAFVRTVRIVERESGSLYLYLADDECGTLLPVRE